MATDREPTREELLNPGRDDAIVNLGVVAHWIAEQPDLCQRLARYFAGGPGGKVPPVKFIQAWLAASHDVLMPDCPQDFPRPDRAAILAAPPWPKIPGGWG